MRTSDYNGNHLFSENCQSSFGKLLVSFAFLEFERYDARPNSGVPLYHVSKNEVELFRKEVIHVVDCGHSPRRNVSIYLIIIAFQAIISYTLLS